MAIDEKKINEIIELFQKEIPVIHESAKTVALIKNPTPGEIPVIHRTTLSLPLIEKERAFLFCQVKAEIQYHLACAAAEKKLAADLLKCSSLLIPPRPARPARTARPKKRSKR